MVKENAKMLADKEKKALLLKANFSSVFSSDENNLYNRNLLDAPAK